MKKIFGVLMALALCVSMLGVGALADEESAVDEAAAQTAAEEKDTVIESEQEQTAAVPASASFAGTVLLTVSADKSEVKAGDTVTFTISVNNAADSGIAAVEFGVVLPDELEATSSTVECNDVFQLAAYNMDAAWFTGTTYLLAGVNTASWPIMTLTCTVKSGGEMGAKSVTLSNVVVSESSTNPINYTVQPASVKLTHDHEWGNGVETTAATCTEKGVKTYTCSVCGETKTEEIAAKGHTWDAGVETTAATCTEKGVTTYTCSVCKETKAEEIPAKGHTWDEGVETKAATCTEDGETTYTCTVCGEKKTEVIAAGHTWDEGVVTKEATTTAKGEKTYTCTVCGETKTEEIPMLASSGSTGNRTESPKTGDETNVVLWVVLMTVCAAGAAAVAVRMKKDY